MEFCPVYTPLTQEDAQTILSMTNEDWYACTLNGYLLDFGSFTGQQAEATLSYNLFDLLYCEIRREFGRCLAEDYTQFVARACCDNFAVALQISDQSYRVDRDCYLEFQARLWEELGWFLSKTEDPTLLFLANDLATTTINEWRKLVGKAHDVVSQRKMLPDLLTSLNSDLHETIEFSRP